MPSQHKFPNLHEPFWFFKKLESCPGSVLVFFIELPSNICVTTCQTSTVKQQILLEWRWIISWSTKSWKQPTRTWNCRLYVKPGWPRWKQTLCSRQKPFNALMPCLCTYRISQPCFSRFSGSVWSCCRWNAGTLSVYRTGCDRRENGCPENIR